MSYEVVSTEPTAASASATTPELHSVSPPALVTQQKPSKSTGLTKLKLVRIKKSVTYQHTLSVAIAATTLAQQLATIAPFPGASAAVSILLLALNCVQKIQKNQDACWRLVERSAGILLIINEQMDGRWDSAPPLLLKNIENFKETLLDIYEFMQTQVKLKWHLRLLQTASISDTLTDLNARLDDASRSFQIATLINIQYAIDPLNSRRMTSEAEIAGKASQSGSGLAREEKMMSIQIIHPGKTVAPVEPSMMESSRTRKLDDKKTPADYLLTGALTDAKLEDDHGFFRYHQSQIKLLGKSRRRKDLGIMNNNHGWYHDTYEVFVNGQKALMKRYNGTAEAAKAWTRDVVVLSNIFHPNLPQMIGYSSDLSPTKFILLSNVGLMNPQSLVMHSLRSLGIANVVDVLLRFYSDMVDGYSYTQGELGLNNNQMQDFIEKSDLRIEEGKNLIVSLPKPQNRRNTTWRNYDLGRSVRKACFGMLPNEGRYYKLEDMKGIEVSVDLAMRIKINHLALLMEDLLTGTYPLSDRVSSLINEREELDAPITSLRQLRLSNLYADLHQQTWNAAPIIPYTFEVGDLVYFPDNSHITDNGLKRFQGSIKICNVLTDNLTGRMERPKWRVLQHTHATQGTGSSGAFQQVDAQQINVFHDTKAICVPVLPGEETVTSVSHERYLESPSEAWTFLLDKASFLAKQAGVQPHDLILVTKVGTDQCCRLRDASSRPDLPGSFSHGFGHSSPATGFRPMGSGLGYSPGHRTALDYPVTPSSPSVFFLMTSYYGEHTPFFSSTPMQLSSFSKPPPLQMGYNVDYGIKWGSMNYVQLHPEDFEGWDPDSVPNPNPVSGADTVHLFVDHASAAISSLGEKFKHFRNHQAVGQLTNFLSQTIRSIS